MKNVIAFNFSDENISVMNDGVLALSNFFVEENLGSSIYDIFRPCLKTHTLKMFIKDILMFKWVKYARSGR